MIPLYNLSVKSYSLAVKIASLFNSKAAKWVVGRKNLLERIEETVVPGERIVWFHAASLGEFEQGRPVMEAIKKEHPQFKILLTFFSPSGYEIRKDYEGADYVFYLPIDTASNARRFIDLVKPERAYFIKYEFWYHYLTELKRRQIPAFIISAIFRENQLFFKSYGGFYRKMLRCFTHLFVQNDESAGLLRSIGVENVSVTGDTRFDRVFEIASQARELPLIEQFKQKSRVLIAGSTWPRDEENIIKYINETNEPLRFIIAPHEVDEVHVRAIVSRIKPKVVCYTKASGQEIEDARVLVVDCIGILSSLYRYGDVAYIGGGFGKGIHNTLEAATFGMPVIFGPNYQKFREAVDLISCRAAHSYNQYNQLETLLEGFWSDTDSLLTAGKAAREYVDQHRGAARKILAVS